MSYGGDARPYARIEQTGRWTYSVSVVHDVMEQLPASAVFGRRRAEAKGRSLLRRYLKREARSAGAWKIYEGEAAP